MLCKLITVNARYIHSCLALFYVRAALEENLPDCRVEIMQAALNDPYYPTLLRIGSGDPAALFFSVYIWNSSYIQRLACDLARLLPGIPIVLGGPQAKALAGNLPSAAACRCTVVHGEIEGLDSTFYQDLLAGSLQGTYNSRPGSTFASPYRPEDFAAALQNRNIYYEASRGCPYGCTYCLSAAEKGVRHLPTPQVHAEIKAILAHAPRVIRFVDRTFNDRPERALDIWRFLKEEGGKTLFHFEMAPDRFTEEMFAFLEQVGPGRFQFELGIQSTNPETLGAINRKCDLEKAGAAIRRLVALDTIHIHLDLILGLPHEDRDSFARSFAQVFALGPHYIQMGLLKVLPDTPISRCVDEYAMLVCADPPYEILANRWLSRGEIGELFWFGECVESFYNNRFFRSVWQYLRRTGEDIFLFFTGLLRLCRARDFFAQAATQELLSSMLHEVVQDRPDRDLFLELLIFDWLRCGHHFLPGHLECESLVAQRNRLWKRMPQNLAPHYDYASRDEFFKQGVFVQFSGPLLKETGLADGEDPEYVCFLPAREERVFKHSRVVLIPGFCAAVT